MYTIPLPHNPAVHEQNARACAPYPYHTTQQSMNGTQGRLHTYPRNCAWIFVAACTCSFSSLRALCLVLDAQHATVKRSWMARCAPSPVIHAACRMLVQLREAVVHYNVMGKFVAAVVRRSDWGQRGATRGNEAARHAPFVNTSTRPLITPAS